MEEISDVASNRIPNCNSSNVLVDGDYGEEVDCLSVDLDDVSSKYMISPGFTKYWVPKCEKKLKPCIGQCFKSLDEAYNFYIEYARSCGFDVRKATEKSERGKIRLKHFTCNREGRNTIGDKKNTMEETDRASSTGKRRRTLSKRCGCTARVKVKAEKKGGFVVYGFNERHTHRLVPPEGRQFMRSNRGMTDSQKMFAYDAAKVKIGVSQAHHLMKEMLGGYENVGATVTDFRNWNRDMKQGIGEKDAQIILDKFKEKQDIHDGFYFEYDTDGDGHLTKLFWADPIGRRNYEVFGDVVSFDATFGTNKYNMVFVPFCGVDNHRKCVTFAAGLLSKEDIPHYTWVFRAFLNAMGREPLCVLTDQCPAMKQAVPAVFTNTRHRLCMWHIMKKLSTKVGPVMCKDGEFMSKIKQFVWGENLNAEEFEEGWKAVIEEFGLSGNDWLREMFEMREMWIPAYFRDDPLLGILRTTSWSESANAFFGKYNKNQDTLTEFYVRFETAMDRQRNINARLNTECLTSLPKTVTDCTIEKDAAEVYTRGIFYLVQTEIKRACYNLSIQSLVCSDVTRELVIKDPHAKGKEFEVKHRLADDFVECSCKLLERTGVPCSHVFLALKQVHASKLPRSLVLNRWIKNAELKAGNLLPSKMSTECGNMQKSKAMVNDIMFDFNTCLGLVGLKNEDLEYVATAIKQLKHELRARRGTNVVAAKKDVIQKLIGSEIPEEVTVMPPNESRNKGCGKKRIVGEAEKAIVQREKRKRLCAACNQLAYHDKRNCPTYTDKE